MGNHLFNTWIGLLGLAVVLYYVFNDTTKTTRIIGGAAGVGSQFVDSLQARSPGVTA